MVSGELRHALREIDVPTAVIDRDALDANLDALADRAHGLPIRVATKSLRTLPAIERALAHPAFSGVLAFSLLEALTLHDRGITDIVVGYPSVDRTSLRRLLSDPSARSSITLMVDSTDHLHLLTEVAATLPDAPDTVTAGAPAPVPADTTAPPLRVCIDIDASYRLGEGRFGDRFHIGARRSPLREVTDVVDLTEQIRARPGLRLVGLMAYEGQIAGTADAGRTPSQMVVRAMQARSAAELAARRHRIVSAVRAITDLEFVNGGGTGSLETSTAEGTLTEVACGSGLFSPGLFDGYTRFRHDPAAYFVTPVVRRPGPGWVTVSKGGFIASGVPGPDRVPTIAWPAGLDYSPLEAAGEVQTPLQGPGTELLRLGDLVWFRHAKAGELAEHFARFLVVADGEVTDSWTTYRGEGWVL